MNMTQLQPPLAAPLALAEARAFLRLDHEADDALISAFIATATEACEGFTGRSLITQRWRLTRSWPNTNRVILGRSPVQSIEDVRQLSRDSAMVIEPSSYWLDRASDPPVLQFDDLLASGLAPLNLEIDYTAGYGDDWNAVPMSLRQGMLRLVAYQYRVRDGGGEGDDAGKLPSAVAALWAPFRIIRL